MGVIWLSKATNICWSRRMVLKHHHLVPWGNSAVSTPHSEWAVACQLMALLTELRVSELMPECAWQVVAVVVFCLWQLFLLNFYGFVFTSRRYKSNTNNRRSILLLLYVIREMWRPPQSPGSMSSQLTICSHCMQTAFRFLLESHLGMLLGHSACLGRNALLDVFGTMGYFHNGEIMGRFIQIL